ncbi:inner membrane protein [Escherichia coli]|uniref:Inner membrane protein n=1 Tax=Escherichia coli TaxID=562 RepID=A0A376TQV4_ECOLX|nr:inner membrane protein [Escherichia coli]
MAIVRDPQKASLPWTGPLRCLIKTALLVAPLYVFVAAWALWLRVAQYGWTVDRLQGALAVLGVTGVVAGVFCQYRLA